MMQPFQIVAFIILLPFLTAFAIEDRRRFGVPARLFLLFLAFIAVLLILGLHSNVRFFIFPFLFALFALLWARVQIADDFAALLAILFPLPTLVAIGFFYLIPYEGSKKPFYYLFFFPFVAAFAIELFASLFFGISWL
jgi:hypothetical protein